jgi:hypothetical protein
MADPWIARLYKEHILGLGCKLELLVKRGAGLGSVETGFLGLGLQSLLRAVETGFWSRVCLRGLVGLPGLSSKQGFGAGFSLRSVSFFSSSRQA